MTTRYPLVLVNGYPQEISDTDRIANYVNIPRGTTQPGPAVDGDLWMDTGNNLLKVYDGSVFVAVGGSGAGGTSIVSSTTPSQPTNGTLWYDTANGVLKIYLASSVQWVPAQLNFFDQAAAPSSGFYEGDIWLNSATRVFSLYIAGSTNDWVPMNGQIIAETSQVINTNYTLNSGKNGHSVGPVEIANTYTVTLPNNAVWFVS